MSMIQVEQTERVAWVTLNNPPLNILTPELLDELGKALDGVRATPASVVVLDATPEARVFSAGIHVANHKPPNVAAMLAGFHGVLNRLHAMPQVTLAALDNSAYGGGFELALACDMVVASRAAVVGFPEIKIACFPPVGVAALPALCARAMASDLILTGDPISAERAREFGLLSRVFAPEKFGEELRALVAQLAERSPAVLRLTAGLVRRRFGTAYTVELAAAERAFKEELAKLPDMAEGIEAFLDKRAPKWED
ncbi:MAG: enoyl-CoA hydratase/isomerase family protein [Acidobacteriota bacterium]